MTDCNPIERQARQDQLEALYEAGTDQAAPFAAGLTVDTDPDAAWLTPSLDLAHERQALLRHVLGWSTEIRACAATA